MLHFYTTTPPGADTDTFRPKVDSLDTWDFRVQSSTKSNVTIGLRYLVYLTVTSLILKIKASTSTVDNLEVTGGS